MKIVKAKTKMKNGGWRHQRPISSAVEVVISSFSAIVTYVTLLDLRPITQYTYHILKYEALLLLLATSYYTVYTNPTTPPRLFI